MRVDVDVPLAPLTTLRLGGPARRLLTATSRDEVAEAVRAADEAGERLLVMAGGSNLVLADAGWPGTVLRIATRGIELRPAGANGDVEVEVEAGEDWDPVVARCVREALAGLECLSGIPGSTGATPVQNVGAYGQEVAETIVAVTVLDRRSGEIAELAPEACGFGYRTSAFKGSDRHVVLAVRFRLRRDELGEPVRYAELARALGVEVGERVPLEEVRRAVLGLRRGKGMVIDPCDADTVSAGSFFTNPVLPAEAFAQVKGRAERRLGAAPPAFPDADGHVKTSAAWLIERAGFARGFARGRAAVSSKHTLALTNRGGTTAELIALAREIRDGVRDAFGVTLEPEPTLVGVSLD